MGGRPRSRERHVHQIVQQLHAIRRSKKVTLENLGQKLGYNSYTIGRWERGEMPPTLYALTNWAESLGCELTIGLAVKVAFPSKQKMMAGR
jgi:transcriptional regulator with XRE-family HTH domain